MTREFLKGLGLSDEAIEKVMAEYGRNINQLKLENEELKEKEKSFSELEKAKKALEEELKGANESIKEQKDKLKETENGFTKYKNDVRLEKALKGAGFKSSDIAKKLIDLDKLKFNDDKIDGLDEAIEELKKSSEYLFEKTESANEDDGKSGAMMPHKPETSTGDAKSKMASQIDEIFNN